MPASPRKQPGRNRRRPESRMGLLTALGIGALMATGLAGGASADGYLGSRVPEPSPPLYWEEPGEPIPVEGTGWTPVIAELENAEARIRRAWHNVATAQVLLTHARVRRYPRGEPFFEIRDRVTFLEAERDTAEDEFLALVERTRRGGMPAGTLSPFMDFSDEIRRDRASRNAKP